ncbi:MAG TPA: hypothetical protein VFQ84_07425 [Arenimonas sp.]|uniref:hypothetical protein n=1 Tax=Arenimonas sp. TaxID=1872635 RepID=UPI002D7EAB2C|nr:hypothetical protein [Arenimonas sp.]HEU0153157.1 hypothetical protein [Arenimonas sp.]
MPDLPQGEATYELRYCGALRCHGPHRQTQMHLLLWMQEEARFVRVWMPLDRLPLMPLGSLWRNRTAVTLPKAMDAIQPDLAAGMDWIGLQLRPGHLDLDMGDWIDPAFPHPAGLWRFLTREGVETYLPVTELIRTHYLFDARLLPSIAGGLAQNGHLTGKARQAWQPEHTGWIDHAGGHARFRGAPFLTDDAAFRLARVVLDVEGVRGLNQLYATLRELRAKARGTGDTDLRRAFPAVGLPYETDASWMVSTRPLPPGQSGQPRQLVLRIDRHSAPPPWQSISLSDGSAPRKAPSPTAAGAVKTTTPFRLEPLEHNPVTTDSSNTDSRFLPLTSRDVRTVDEEARLYRTDRKLDPPAEEGTSDPRRMGRRKVQEAGAQLPGRGGEGRPVATPDQTDAAAAAAYVPIGDDLRPVLDIVGQLLVAGARGETIHCQFRPSRDLSYSFQMPARGKKVVDPRIRSRQFLIFECVWRGTYVYVVEPARRAVSENFPVGVIYTLEKTRLTWGDITKLARDCEIRRRQSHSWIEDGRIGGGEMLIIGLDHPPSGQPSDSRKKAFASRIADTVALALGLFQT